VCSPAAIRGAQEEEKTQFDKLLNCVSPLGAQTARRRRRCSLFFRRSRNFI
jgi:hypothetical protein